MYFCALSKLNSVLTLLLLAYFFTLSDTLLNGWTTFLDASSRLSPTSTNFETYSFWWTTLLYLAPFFFLLVLISTGFTYRYRNSSHHLLLVFFFMFYLVEVVDYTPLNFTDALTIYTEYGLNILLTNSLNKYHPFVFYMSTILFFLIAIVTVILRVRVSLFQSVCSILFTDLLSWWAVQINLTALFMGSWWALQEGTWGGWWNWDSSETLGFEVSLFSLALLHSFTYISHQTRFMIRALVSLCFFIATYFFIQLNFELVSHNFGSKFFFFFNNNLFSMEVIFLTILGMLWLLRLNSLTWTRLGFYRQFMKYTMNSNTKPSLFIFLPCLIILMWFFWSYKPLLNYFVWNFFGLNSFNYESSIQPYNFLFFVALFGWIFSVPSRSGLELYLLVSVSGNWLWVLSSLLFPNSRLVFIHYLLVLFTGLNLTLADVYSVSWFPCHPYLQVSFAPVPIWSSNEILVEEANSWECVIPQTSLAGVCHENWNLITFSNVTSINFFFLNLSQSLCSNYYDLGFSYLRIYLKIELFGIPTLAILFFIGTFLFSSIRNRIGTIPF